MSEQYKCYDCGQVHNIEELIIKCPLCGCASFEHLRWIPVSERLPEYMERVVFFGGGEMTTHIGYYVPELPQWTAEDGGYFHGKNAALITHWMPLPEPPEDE